MRVLVTDGETNKALAVVRAIADVASHVGVTSRFPASPAGLSRHADEQYWLREREPEVVVERLNAIGATGDYDYLLPVGGRTFEVVSEHRDRLAFPLERLLPPGESMRTAVRKADTYALAAETGVPVPTTLRLHDDRGFDTVESVVGYPAVLKTGVETETRFVRTVRSRAELAEAFATYRADHDADAIVQELLPGPGRGYFGLYVDGDPVGGYAHRRIREYPPEGGASACAVSEQDAELERYSRRLMAALDWTGVAMVEFKEDAHGTPALVEINPKFWGSLDLAVASGLNLPRAQLEYADTGEVPEGLEFVPRRVHWPLSGDLTHAWRRPRSAPAVARDLLSPDTGSNLRLEDPLPHVLEGLITLVRWDL